MKHFLRSLGVVTLAAFATFACGLGGNSSSNTTTTNTGSTPAASTAAVDTTGGAADLRTKLDILLGEHIYLATKATGAAVGGRTAEYQAYGGLLDQNGKDLGAMIGSVYGKDAETQFNDIWSKHNGNFVDYTVAASKGDAAGKQKAVDALTNGYIPNFAKFLSGATGLPEQTLKDLLGQHIAHTAAIVNDEVAKDYTKEYTDIRVAYSDMAKIGDPLAGAIAKKFPDKFSGDGANKGVDLRVALNQLLQEHIYLASLATGSALGGRTDEFTAAATALTNNGHDLGDAIGGLYGADAGTQFKTIWDQHNGFFVTYTQGVAAKDAAKKQTAVDGLTKVYIPSFATFLAGATDLPNATLTDLIGQHVAHTAAIVDKQGANDWAAASANDRSAAQQMAMIADPLASAIVKKLPTKFQ